MKNKRYINKTPMDTLIAFMEKYEKAQKDINAGSSIHKDTLPALVKLEAHEDNGDDLLSPGRFFAMPICEPDQYWKYIPSARKERYKSLNLKYVGCEAQISKGTINRNHCSYFLLWILLF